MELRQLQSFVAVARHRNVTRAAEDLYDAQLARRRADGRR